VSFKNTNEFGGVKDIEKELQSVKGRNPFFEHPLILFTPRVPDEDMNKARIENQGDI
jgi:hypothetical protein